uniref:Uncharacterized protein n=1 Tax=Oryza rufipogon TaxID=4529 RepID=A0A0E0MUA3_ORYRU
MERTKKNATVPPPPRLAARLLASSTRSDVAAARMRSRSMKPHLPFFSSGVAAFLLVSLNKVHYFHHHRNKLELDMSAWMGGSGCVDGSSDNAGGGS